MKLKILITGGCGFIGSNLVKLLVRKKYKILNIDKLTYAGNTGSLSNLKNDKNYSFKKVDIANLSKLKNIFFKFKPDWVMHLAAESHVDRSIDSPGEFIKTNINGTFNLLTVSRQYFSQLDSCKKKIFRFHHISTDEVYGDLNIKDSPAKESNKYLPSSPYSASKAAADHLVRAWFKTYGLPIIITNTSNNYGPFQYPEKLIPHTILAILHNKQIPIYGNGNQIRDWIFVEDHVEALLKVIKSGVLGETYNIGGNNQIKNIDVVKSICKIMSEILYKKKKVKNNIYKLITFVKDRPGHDFRYGIDQSKIIKNLNWKPKTNFKTGIKRTVLWYVNNHNWWKNIISKGYKLKRKGKKFTT